jgi:hypothetical protein
VKTQFGLAPTLGLLQQLSSPELGDSDVTIPSVMLPVLEVPASWSGYVGLTAGSVAPGVMNQTVAVGINLTRNAAAGLQTTRVLDLGQGLWRVFMSISASIPAINDGCDVTFGMRAPSGAIINGGMIRFLETGARYYGARDIEFRIPVPVNHRYVCDIDMDNTGGATTMELDVHTVATKLLG